MSQNTSTPQKQKTKQKAHPGPPLVAKSRGAQRLQFQKQVTKLLQNDAWCWGSVEWLTVRGFNLGGYPNKNIMIGFNPYIIGPNIMIT